jgi:hypothetical protein
MASRRDDEFSSQLGFLMLLALAVCVYLVAMAVWLVASTLAQHPDNKPLWLALGAAITAAALAWAGQGASPVLNGLAGLAITALLITAGTVKTYYDPLVQRPITKEVFIDDILERPWFTT